MTKLCHLRQKRKSDPDLTTIPRTPGSKVAGSWQTKLTVNWQSTGLSLTISWSFHRTVCLALLILICPYQQALGSVSERRSYLDGYPFIEVFPSPPPFLFLIHSQKTTGWKWLVWLVGFCKVRRLSVFVYLSSLMSLIYGQDPFNRHLHIPWMERSYMSILVNIRDLLAW